MATEDKHIKALALEQTRGLLVESTSFGSLPRDEQEALFRDLYRRNYDNLNRAHSNELAEATARRRGRSDRASDLIDDSRHENRRIDQAGDLAGDFIQEVDFPGFVTDLLEGVFAANLNVTLQQMQHYQTLLKTASSSISKFIKDVGDDAAFGFLAENKDDEFGISFGDDDGGMTGQQKVVLTDKDGNTVDTEDTKIKTAIMDAKIAIAKEHRKSLREALLMGITRLVVEEGRVQASVIFDIKASESVNKADKAALKEVTASARSFHAGFLGIGGGVARRKRKTKISVSSAKSQSNTQLQAKITGNVDIKFKSDYFPLERFGDVMMAEIGAETGDNSGAGGKTDAGKK